MRNLKTRGIIIKKRILGEKDYILTLFTPLYGKIEVHAHGARQISSRFTGHMDLLNVCDFQVYKSIKSNTVVECGLCLAFSKFRENLTKFYYASEIAKILKSFESENCEDIYGLIIETLKAIENYTKESLIFEAFKIKLFSLTGIMPDVYCIEETDFCKADLHLKKLLKFLLNEPYSEIIRLAVNENDEHSLSDLTRNLMEASMY